MKERKIAVTEVNAPLFWLFIREKGYTILMPTGQGLSSLIPKRGEEEKNRETKTETRYASYNVYSESTKKEELPKEKSRQHESVFQIEIDKIMPNPLQPRREFDEEGIDELVQSIREFGILQPLVVSKVTEETELGTRVSYELIAGERRLRAAKKLGLTQVPAIIRAIDANRSKLEMALIENLQRRDLNPMEAARAYARLAEEFGLTQREIAMKVGKSREVIANTLRLLGLPSDMQKALEENKINESQGRFLLSLADPNVQRKTFQDFLEGKRNIRATRFKKETTTPPNPENVYWEKRFEETLGMPVSIQKKGTKGKITISFYSEEDWNSLSEKLLGDLKE